MEPQIIFENENFLAVNKPAGMLVHAARTSNKERRTRNKEQGTKNEKTGEEKTLVEWLLPRYPKIKNVGDDPQSRPGIVHRLDKDTSGIILIPKTQKYFLYLKHLFQEHKIKKTYLAVVFGAPKEKIGIITKPIGIKEGTIKRSVHSKKQAKEAITEYKVLTLLNFNTTPLNFSKVLEGKQNLGGQAKTWEGKSAIASLLEVSPQTGRTHQIRVHLSSIGYPILGDKLYGNKLSIALSNELHIGHQMLHALAVEFSADRVPPKALAVAQGGSASGGEVGSIKKIKIEADPPEEFTRIIDKGRISE